MSPSPSAEAFKRVCSALTMLVLLSTSPVFATTITVTNTNDSGTGSLRAAIASAASGDTINFSLPVSSTITVSTPLTIDSSGSKILTISGGGTLTISGGDLVTVFIIQPLGGLGGPVTATISGLTIENGSSILGGGIFNGGTLTLNNCQVTSNGNSPGTQLGGGIFNAGALTLTNSTVLGNAANPSTTEAGFGGGIYNAGTLSLTKSKVVSNDAFGSVPNVARGGGIYNTGTVILTNSTVRNNFTDTSEEGGLRLGTGYGGGIYNDHGTVRLIQSEVSNNFGGGPINCCPLSGAGILNDTGNVFLTNSTVAGNHTPEGGNGAGFSNFGNLNLSNSTVSGNAASQTGGGILNGAGGSLTLKNSILANNTGGNCSLKFPNTASQRSFGHNLSDDSSCDSFFTESGDLNSTPAGLDPAGLKNNGGPTQTIALLATSPAVNAIPLSPTNSCTDVNLNPVTTDQRGVPRPQGAACDIGAYELFQSRFVVQAVATFLIIDAVQALPLPPGTQQSLIAPLQGAVISINQGNTTSAMNQLGAFINQANALVRGGALTPQQASPLATAAQGVIQSLSNLGG